jgi:hypothetical protein
MANPPACLLPCFVQLEKRCFNEEGSLGDGKEDNQFFEIE